MKRIFLIITILTSVIVQGQTDCKFSKNEIDDMTGEKVVISKSIMMCIEFMGMGLNITPKQINDKYFLSFSFDYPRSFRMDPGDKIIIKLENNDLINLKVNNRVDSEGYEIPTGGYGTTTSYKGTTDVEVTKEILDKLSDQKVSKLRIYFSDGFNTIHTKVSKRWTEGYWEKENFKSKKINDLKKEIKCLLSI